MHNNGCLSQRTEQHSFFAHCGSYTVFRMPPGISVRGQRPVISTTRVSHTPTVTKKGVPPETVRRVIVCGGGPGGIGVSAACVLLYWRGFANLRLFILPPAACLRRAEKSAGTAVTTRLCGHGSGRSVRLRQRQLRQISASCLSFRSSPFFAFCRIIPDQFQHISLGFRLPLPQGGARGDHLGI